MLPTDFLRYCVQEMAVLRWLPGVLLLLPWLLGPLEPSNEQRVRDLAAPQSFRLLDWETTRLGERAHRLLAGLLATPEAAPTDADTLRAYFAAGSVRQTLRPTAEAALERVVAGAYQASGVSRSEPLPLDHLFPPVLVALTAPPNVLVIAPRTELRVIDSSILQAMDESDQARLEASADSNDVSSLVAPIGGLATYPSMVLDGDVAQPVLAAVAHEWLHQYLIFYPLGTGYWSSQETREINETTAEMVGQEVGTQLAADLALATPTAPAAPVRSTFNFRTFMRDTRAQTEQLLNDGQVAAAETYMRSRRDELQQRGYQIRKLNQAYFALYGSYGDGFAASPSNPIPQLLRTLRERSSSLGEFIIQVRGLTSVADLRSAAG